jgi:protein ImuB
MNRPEELYACVYALEFPAQALLRLHPELREKACVVMEGDPPLQQACAVNSKARTLGIELGMTQVEVDTFPAVMAFARSLNEETGTKAALLECAGSFSPRVEDCSQGYSFQCAIDITGTGKLFGPPVSLARKLLAHVRTLGIDARVAVSNNFHTATLLAKGLSQHDPVQVVPAGEESKALAPLPLAVLDLAEAQQGTFSLWGIHTLGMLAALPEKELISRMGQDGKHLQELARGELPHLFQPTESAFTLEEHMDFDSPVEVLDALLFVVNVMLEQLIVRATNRILALASITVTLTLEHCTMHTRTIQPALPSNDRQLWIKLLHLDLEAHPPHAAVLSVALSARPGSTSKVQLGLFSPQLPEPSRLDVTLARVRTIVGEENVGCAILSDTHRPDGFRMEPFTIQVARSSEISTASARPAMRQLRPPEAVLVRLQNERPTALSFRAQHYSVQRAYGPWQSSGDWWNATLWGCEQWDVVIRATDGTLLCCCLVHDLLRNQWQMVALYD